MLLLTSWKDPQQQVNVLLVVTTAVVGLFLLLVLWGGILRVMRRRRAGGEEGDGSELRYKKARSFSYTSNAMVAGSFPPSSQMPETIINAVVWFDDNTTSSCPTVDELAQHVVTPLLNYTRLNSVPDASTSSPRPSSQHYKAADLIRVIEVKEDAGDENESAIYDEIHAHLQDSLTTKQRGDLPWWEVLVIRKSNSNNNNTTKKLKSNRSAVVFRFHHGLADGISLVNAFGNIVTYQDGSPMTSLLEHFTSKQQQTTTTKSSSSTRYHPWNWIRILWLWIRELYHVLTLGLSRYDDDTAFSKHNHHRMTYSGHRRAVIFPPVPLEFLKSLKNAASVTINDVLMTAVSQAITDYCESQQCPIIIQHQQQGNKPKNRIQCRALLPVAFPRPKEQLQHVDTALSNKWCFFSTDLGVGMMDIAQRLQWIHDQNANIKSTPRVFLQLNIQNQLLPFLPASVGQQTLFDIMSRHSLVFSNVPGPDRPVMIAGRHVVSEVQMLYANLIPQIGFLSYAGRMHGNIMLDPDTLPDSPSLAKFYEGALIKLAERLHVPVPQELVTFVEEARRSS